ncbi:zinc dependent phospholipase C family protein [Haloplasma contractile]|uniref:Zinc dependent phospholipase C protein n=1 Tax=Haloplasma contractile SSD-17B TaxID=1033810 RepID=U2ECC4_9MOLU|nr:zinc dependent phospholipase C family protein [Haloplasma contractile]ERJ12426.1 Zinc dependent phospholipase C protein [Haloplasma contractile SSD-17B]
MPDIVTHATFAKDVCEKLEDKKLSELIKNHEDLFYLGAQGPDVFFYNDFQPTRKQKRGPKVGSMMHVNKVRDFFIEAFNYIKFNYDERLYVYMLGFVCHHALDRNAHPYIFHVTGEYDKTDHKTREFRGNHLRLERAIDSIFIKERWNENKPSRFKVYHEILKYKSMPDVFIPFFNKTLEKVYDVKDFGEVFIDATKDFKSYFKVIYDRHGIKKMLASIVDLIFNRKGALVFRTMFYYKNVRNKVDYLNLENRKWSHPVYPEETHNTSFLDMYSKGTEEATSQFNIINQYIKDEKSKEELSISIPDVSYSTGKDWRDTTRMTSFRSIF